MNTTSIVKKIITPSIICALALFAASAQAHYGRYGGCGYVRHHVVKPCPVVRYYKPVRYYYTVPTCNRCSTCSSCGYGGGYGGGYGYGGYGYGGYGRGLFGLGLFGIL